jgi:hypothetical protein
MSAPEIPEHLAHLPRVSVEDLIFRDDILLFDVVWLGFGESGSDPAAKMRMLDFKLDDCKDEFLDDIQENGIKDPICYVPEKKQMRNGNHRLVCAWLLGYTELPYVTDRCKSDSGKHPRARRCCP